MNASKKSGKKSVTAKSQKSTKNPKNNKLQTKAGKSIFERFTGLTLAEFLKLKKLKKTLSGDNGQSGKQISTQQTITFDKMYQDGICKVRKNYYTKMIEFYDLNYVLLDEEERADILGLYSQLINYFDPTISFQIFLFNRHVNEETLAAQFEISPQGDKFDDIREEFSDMLKSLSAKGNNGVIKSKYIIFGIEAENIKEARQRFISLEADIIKNLKNLGTNAKCLDGKERLRVLYEFFNQDKMEPFRFSFKEMAESGNTVKDYIAPQGFEFRFPGRYKMGHMFGATKYLDIISPKLNDELLKRLLDIDSNISISIHMRTIEPTEAIKLLKRALSDVQKTKIDEQKKAVRAGYDMDILPTDIVLYEKNTMELLDDLNTSNQKLIWTTILISSFGRNKKELESVSQRVSGIIQQANCRLIDLQYKQEVAMNAAAPIGINETKEGRHLITKNLAILVPFNTQELFQSGQSLYYGLNALSNNMIMADRKKLRTPNGVILGTPGSGKSFSAKREILGSFLVSRDDILICDPEGEYYPLVKALGGEVVKLATNSKDYLNPMDIQLSHKNDREALKLKSDFLITLCDAIAGGETGLANDEKGIIDRCIEGIYDEYFKDPRPENMPILEDLYNALVKYEPDKAVSEELAIDAKQKAVRIANSLVLYVHGSQNYFNHRTNVDSQNRIVCFDIRDLGKQLKELGMLIVQDAVWNRVSRNRERRVATRYYCDEFHLLLRDKQTAQYSVEIWKRFRKWGGIPTGLTQNVGDFLRSEEIEGILGNSDFVYLLNQNAKDQVILADKLGLSEKQLQYVTNSESGCGLILFNDVVIPFADRYPTDTKTYAIMNTRPQEEEEHTADKGDDADGEEKNNTARKAVSDITGAKPEGFDAKADAGDFKKARAGPTGSADGRSKGSAVKSKAVSEAQEMFNAAPANTVSQAEEKSRKVNQEFFKRHENEDEKNTEYASQREETRALRKHRQHESRTRVKDSFIQSDGDFHGKTSFVEEAGAETAKSHKLEMLEKKAEKAADKTQKARKKLPQRKEYKLVRHFDEKTGKVTYELQTNKVLKKPKSDNPITAANRRAMMEAQGLVHDKISEDEKDNSGVEAAHRTEEAGEAVIVHARNIKHGVQAKRSNKVAALEKKQFKAEVNFRYQKYLEENPEVKKKAIQKRLQKQRIKREYAKALKKGSEAKQAAGYAKKAATTTTNMARKVEEFARKHIGAIATIGLFGLFFMLIAAGISSCSAVLNGGLSATMAGSYQSQPAQLDASDEAMTSREMALQNTIDSIEEDYPDYDEYNYNLEEIGHNPFTLINYLSAIKVDVVAADVDAEIESLFDEMYELTLTPREETRTRTVTVTNEETGEEEEVEEEYTVTILDVELTRKPLEDIVAERLTGNDDASTLYAAYQQTNGALQQFYTPLDTDWYSLIKSYYGYRKNPITGENQFHRGIDIAVPEGTEVYAGHDGTVTTAAYDDDYGNYIVITDSKGFTTKYAHLESMNVSAGQTVRHGEIIGKTGSTGAVTGSHLHLECLSDGEYYNPLFYFENGNGSIYGTTDPIGGSGDVAALIAEAENYLGYPYVWGGSNPSTSFDCSGFVCYVLTHSGYCNMPRTTAQGIYNQCTPISASEARAGDIIFFTGTYNSGNPVTHVGIYAGNGQMIHAGDPIKYSSINTPYWQSHFYSFARVPGH